MLSWISSKLKAGGSKKLELEQQLYSILEFTSQIVPKLLLLTAFFTLLLLLMHNGLVWSPLPTPRQQEEQCNKATAFTSPPMSAVEPTKRLLQPPVKGMPCRELQNRFPNSIPPLVHWTTKDGRVHKKLVNTVQSWLKLNRDGRNASVKWYFMHWDDIQISRLIAKHYPQLSKTYAKLANGLERSDIGRLVVLHHVGGLYVDLDVEMMRDPTPLLMPQYDPLMGEVTNSSNCRTALWSQEPPEHAEFIFNRPWLLSNAVMMSRANHSFLNYVLSAWPTWYEAKWAKKKRKTDDVLFVTGPIMLHTFYEKYAALGKAERPGDWCDSMVAEPEVFQPILDTAFINNWMKRKCVNIEKLSESKQEHCRQILCANFKNRQVPSSSFTVHRFMHLSHTSMKPDDSQCILRMLPILKCKI